MRYSTRTLMAGMTATIVILFWQHQSTAERKVLDIHIADSFDSASRSEPVVSISPKVHATLFGHQNRSAKDSPLLSRLADYHCDCTFFARELQHLIFEIDTLVKDCPLAAAQRHILKQLRDTCELALKQGHSVYVLCD